MGSILYDYLTESVLFNSENIANNFSKLNDDELVAELLKYRQFCIENMEAIQNEIDTNPHSLKSYISTECKPISLLLETALYFDQVILDDPLFKMSKLPSEFEKVGAQFLGFEGNGFSRASLADTCRFLKKTQAFIAANYCKFYPLNYSRERTINVISYHENLGRDYLPDKVSNFFRNRTIIQHLQRTTDGWEPVPGNLSPCRGLSLDFRDHTSEHRYFYALSDTKMISTDDKERLVRFTIQPHQGPPSDNQFYTWREQTLNTVAKGFFDKIASDIYYSEEIHSHYLTDSPFVSDLLGIVLEKQPYNLRATVASLLLKMEVPFTTGIDPETLIKVRQNDGQEFEIYRRTLESRLCMLRSEENPNRLKMKLQDVRQELVDLREAELDQKFSNLKKQAWWEFGVGIAGLAGSFSTGGITLLASFAAFAKGFSTYQQYLNKIKENPVYFLWKVRRSR